MAASLNPSSYQRARSLKTLLRPAGWGAAAAAALALAVFAATTDKGSQRLAAALTPSQPATAAVPPVPLAQFLETEAETRRLAEAVRSLTSDRESLIARIASLERSLDDVTSSIQRQALPSMPSPADPRPAVADIPVATPVMAPAEPPEPRAKPEPEAAIEPPGAAFGVDVGGAVNVEGLRALWHSTRTAFAAGVEGMHPVLAVREHPKTRQTEFRLVIGPLADEEAATNFCATLTAARRYCRPVPFEGQQLSFAGRAPTPARRPAASQQERKATVARPSVRDP